MGAPGPTGAVSTPTTGIMSLREGMVDRQAVMGLTVGGLVGVAIAVFLVKSMSLDMLQWMVIAVVLFTSVRMFLRAFKDAGAKEGEAAPAPVKVRAAKVTAETIAPAEELAVLE